MCYLLSLAPYTVFIKPPFEKEIDLALETFLPEHPHHKLSFRLAGETGGHSGTSGQVSSQSARIVSKNTAPRRADAEGQDLGRVACPYAAFLNSEI